MAAIPASQRAIVADRDAEIASLQALLAAERATVASLRSAAATAGKGDDTKRTSRPTRGGGLASPKASSSTSPSMWQRSFSEVPVGALTLTPAGKTISATEARRLALRELKAPRAPNRPTKEIKKAQFVEWRWKQLVEGYDDEPIQYKLEFNVLPGSVWRLYSKGISESKHKVTIKFDAGDIKACCLGREVKFRIMYRLLSGGKSSPAYECWHLFKPRPVIFTYGPLSDTERLDLKTFSPEQLYGRVVMRSDESAGKLINRMAKVVHMDKFRIHLLDADFTLKENNLVRRISSKNMCVAVLDHAELPLHDYGIPSSTHLHFEPLALNDGKNLKGFNYAMEWTKHHLTQLPHNLSRLPGQILTGQLGAGSARTPSFPVFVGLLNRRCKTAFELDPTTTVDTLYKMIQTRFGTDRSFRLIFEGKAVALEPPTALVTSFGIIPRSQLVADFSDIQDFEMTVVDTLNRRRKVKIDTNLTPREVLDELSLDPSQKMTIMQMDMSEYLSEEAPRTLAELGITFEETLFVDPLICVWDGQGLPINIKMPSGVTSKFVMRDITTVRTLKSFIQGQAGIPQAEQRLLLNGAQLENDTNVDRSMMECKVTADTTLTLVLRVLFRQGQQPISVNTSGVTSPVSDAAISPTSPDHVAVTVVEEGDESEL